MKTYEENGPALQAVFSRLETRVASLPPHLREQGAAFLTWAGPGYFTQADAAPLLHLPLWMPQPVAPEVMADVLDATALAYAYVRIQDNVIDEPGTRGNPPMLLVGNALLWDAMALWHRHTEGRFAQEARRAWVEFSEQTEAERRQLLRTDGYSAADFEAHARKCALAELPLYAVMSASGDWTGAAAVRPLVHGLARSYGCVNDVLGWERDLSSGANTYLLSAARALAGPSGLAGEVRRALLFSPLLETMLAEAERALEDCRAPAAELRLREFDRFLEERGARLRALTIRVSLVRLAAVTAS